MFLAYVMVAATAVLANAYFAVADFRRTAFVRATSTTVGVPERWFPLLGGLKVAGAGGLVLGLLGAAWLGVAAAVGLVAFYTCALLAHLRVRALTGIGCTIAMWTTAVACLSLALALLSAGESTTLV